MTTLRLTTRRAVLSGAATLPALAVLASPQLAESASPTADRADLARFDDIVAMLRTAHVCEGWTLDETAAAAAREHLGAPEDSPEKASSAKAFEDFMNSHGQSYDWVIRGDPISMICAAAAASARAGLGDPIFAAIDRYRAARATFLERDTVDNEVEAAGGVIERASADDRRSREMVVAVDAIIEARAALAETTPTTIHGLAALARVLADGLCECDGVLFDGRAEQTNFVMSLEGATCALAGVPIGCEAVR